MDERTVEQRLAAVEEQLDRAQAFLAFIGHQIVVECERPRRPPGMQR